MGNPYWDRVVTINGKEYDARKWGHDRRTDVYGNNRACQCADLLRVNIFCVCIGKAYCPTHKRLQCVGGHD